MKGCLVQASKLFEFDMFTMYDMYTESSHFFGKKKHSKQYFYTGLLVFHFYAIL